MPPVRGSAWDRPLPGGNRYLFRPYELGRCVAVDRRRGYDRPDAPERRKSDRPCDRAFLMVSPGTELRVAVAPDAAGTRLWPTPGGLHTCAKCSTNLELEFRFDPTFVRLAGGLETQLAAVLRDAGLAIAGDYVRDGHEIAAHAIALFLQAHYPDTFPRFPADLPQRIV